MERNNNRGGGGGFQVRVEIKCDGWGGEAETNATPFILIDSRQFGKIIEPVIYGNL